ncbi:MFS transporter [Roseibium sp.]|uniref:MFS transporter n=1 Tax=Roseibium sp. TaxID=1936156 RepID=UPI0025E164E7|nr:MFS transporter [Roseibium sp.]
MSQSPEHTHRPLWRDTVAVGLLMTATLKIMANATISPALPALEASFSEEPMAAYLTRFLVSAPSLSVVLVAPFAGLAADRFGRGPLLLAGVILFAVAGSAGSYLPDLNAILASRFLLGIAVALTMTAQVALVGDLFSGSNRSAFMGWQVAAVNFSGFFYIGFAGLLAGTSPRLPFLIYALPLFLVPLLAKIHREERQRGRAQTKTTSDETRLSGSRSWLLPAISVGLLTMVTVMLFFLMPSQLPYFLDLNGFDSATGTAIGLGVLTLTGGAVAILFKRVSDALGVPATFALGFTLMAAGFGALALEAVWPTILAGASLVGAGYGLVQPSFLMLALQIAPASRRGSVSGIVTTAMFLGQVISPLVLTPLILSRGFPVTFIVAATALGLCALAALSALLLPQRLRKRTT